MSNTNRSGITRGICVALMLSVIGCDELPVLPLAETASVPSDMVTDSGRGGYHWRLNGPHFEMMRPTSFSLPDDVDPELIRQNLAWPTPQQRQAWSKPAEMDEDVYQWFRRLMEPHPEPELLMELQRSDDIGVDNVCFNRPGTRLLTVAKKLIEWDVQTGERVKEFDAPFTNCKEVFFDASYESAVLHNGENLVRVSLADGRILHRWKPPKGQIEFCHNADEADVQALVTTTGQVYALSNNFGEVTEYKDKKFTSKRISIHPKGLWVLGIADGAAARWRLDQPGNPTEIMPVEQLDEATCVPMAGARVDRWADIRFIHELEGTHEPLMETMRYPFIMPNAYIISVGNATLDGSLDWTVFVGEKFDPAGKPYYFVQEIRSDAFRYSEPWPLPVESYDKLFCDGMWERMGFLVGDKLRVFERRRWVDPDGWGTAQRISSLLVEGRTEQLELCAKELRNTPVHLNGRRGEEIYFGVVDQIAGQWARLESEPASEEIMQQIDQWHQRGSELALVASANRHLKIGYEARGGGYADSVAPEAWRTLENRNQLASDEIMQLLNQGKVCPSVLSAYISSCMIGEGTYQDVEPWLTQCIEKYPDDVLTLGAMCNWLLPRWGGSMGEGGALVGALSARYPAPEGDLIYAGAALQFTAMLTAEPLQSEAGFSLTKVLDAVDPILTRGNATRYEVELLMEVAQQAQKKALVQRLAQYHIEHFGMPAHHAYQRNLISLLVNAREAKLENARKNESAAGR